MQRRWIFLGVFLCVIAAIGFWVRQIDWERYRPELAAQISSALGADVRLNGRLSIRFFPYPKLSADDAELTAPGLHIQAPHLRLSAKLWPLLRGRVTLSSAEIENPKIVITPALWQAPAQTQGNGSRTKIQLEDVEIENGEVDMTMGRNHEVMSEIDVQLRAPDWHGPYQAEGDFVWRGQDWEINSQIGVKTAAGTRPAEIALRQSDGPHQFSWRGAVQPVPLTLRGDGVWQSATNHLSLKAEVNLTRDLIDILHGALSSADKDLGAINGHFAIAQNSWQDLTADLIDASPSWLGELISEKSNIHLQKITARGLLKFRMKNNSLINFQFQSPQINAALTGAHWHLWGHSGVDALALAMHQTAWPDELRAPFDVRMTENKNGFQIENLRLGKFQAHGALGVSQLNLETDTLSWPLGDADDAWREILRQLGVQAFTLHAHALDFAPFTSGDSKLALTLHNDIDHLVLQTPDMNIAGDFEDGDFKGGMECLQNHLLQIFRAPCTAAQISSDGHTWQFDGASGWHGLIDFAASTWNLKIPFTHGELSGAGKLGQPDWHMDIAALGLHDILQNLLPTAPKGDGDVSGQLHVTAGKADGDITATNLQLPALNLWLDNPAQPGKIGTLTAKINVQGDVLELQQLRTSVPDGTGHASVNLESKVWHGDWIGVHGRQIAIDGDADNASAQKQRVIDPPSF